MMHKWLVTVTTNGSHWKGNHLLKRFRNTVDKINTDKKNGELQIFGMNWNRSRVYGLVGEIQWEKVGDKLWEIANKNFWIFYFT